MNARAVRYVEGVIRGPGKRVGWGGAEGPKGDSTDDGLEGDKGIAGPKSDGEAVGVGGEGILVGMGIIHTLKVKERESARPVNQRNHESMARHASPKNTTTVPGPDTAGSARRAR